MNKNFKNYAFVDTVQPSENWKKISQTERIELIYNQLHKYQGAETFKVEQADENGQIVIAVDKNIPANERGLYLLELEQTLKEYVDQGLHLWCEPVGDKSALRKLRGVVIKS
tara:strand:+ start:129 stop:464 length:336 start_codon:yes stop_codon:yes gene_type:complete